MPFTRVLYIQPLCVRRITSLKYSDYNQSVQQKRHLKAFQWFLFVILILNFLFSYKSLNHNSQAIIELKIL